MNDQTAALVGQLAAKLGTTSEYLWSVLLKQAPVYATIAVVELALTLVVAAVLFKYRQPIGAKLTRFVEEAEFLGVMILVVAGVVSLIWTIGIIIGLERSVTAIVNPEYWALKEVLSAVKGK